MALNTIKSRLYCDMLHVNLFLVYSLFLDIGINIDSGIKCDDIDLIRNGISSRDSIKCVVSTAQALRATRDDLKDRPTFQAYSFGG